MPQSHAKSDILHFSFACRLLFLLVCVHIQSDMVYFITIIMQITACLLISSVKKNLLNWVTLNSYH